MHRKVYLKYGRKFSKYHHRESALGRYFQMKIQFLHSIRTQLTLQLDDPLKRSGKVPLAR